MASNYNMLTRPPVVFVGDGGARPVVRRSRWKTWSGTIWSDPTDSAGAPSTARTARSTCHINRQVVTAEVGRTAQNRPRSLYVAGLDGYVAVTP